jgi:DNA-binding protein HU-beta
MRKIELIKEISERIGVETERVEATISALMSLVEEHLIRNETVYLIGFGTFMIKRQEAKIARKISTNMAIKLPAQYVPVFKPAKQFSDRVKRIVND